MKVINADNVNDALYLGIRLMKQEGLSLDSRVGKTLEIPCPVTTVYKYPLEKVLISKERDANPFFHFMESMWILAGREDVKFLTEFNKRMAEYSDDGVTFNAPYGYRLRTGFNTPYGNRLRTGVSWNNDQLSSVINILKNDPNSRQAVCQIWDDADLNNFETKDKACNMSLVFRMRQGLLDLTVYNRSNDMIWGAYGANVVQFSTILEYVAAHVNVPIGNYTHVSNAFHVYTEGPGGKAWDKLKNYTITEPYDNFTNLRFMTNCEIDSIDHDLQLFFSTYDANCSDRPLLHVAEQVNYESRYFNKLVMPMLHIYNIHKNSGPEDALIAIDVIESDDWRQACKDWLEIRLENRKNK